MTPRLTLICSLPTRALRAAAFPADEPLDPAQPPITPPRFRQMDRVWTSPALRARQTAEALGFTATVEDALRDCAYGRWTGRGFAEVQAEEPDAMAAWTADPAAAPHGGESILDLLARVARWLDGHGNDAGHTVAVTHSAIIRAAVVHALQAPPAAFWRMDVEPFSLTELRPRAGRWTLRIAGGAGAPL